MPPLRDRIEDFVIIVADLMTRISSKYGIKPISIPDHHIHQLMRYAWPGNIRQLGNFIERFLLLSDSIFDPDVFDELFQELETHNISDLNVHAQVVRQDTMKKSEYAEKTSSMMCWLMRCTVKQKPHRCLASVGPHYGEK